MVGVDHIFIFIFGGGRELVGANLMSDICPPKIYIYTRCECQACNVDKCIELQV